MGRRVRLSDSRVIYKEFGFCCERLKPLENSIWKSVKQNIFEQYYSGCYTKKRQKGKDSGSRKPSQKTTEITEARADGGMDHVEAVQSVLSGFCILSRAFAKEDLREVKKLNEATNSSRMQTRQIR